MKKSYSYFYLLTLVATSMLLFVQSCGSSADLATLRKKDLKQKVKELKEQGWYIDSGSKTLELALAEHKYKLENNPKLREFETNVSMCRSLNVCKANAINNALREYADYAGSTVKGKAVTDMSNNSSAMSPEEFDKFYAAYVRNIETEIKGELQPSYALIKDNSNGKSYKMLFIIDEEGASNSRKKAMQRALEETKLSIEYALWVEKFVNEDPLKDKE